jgi:hypothetical protein
MYFVSLVLSRIVYFCRWIYGGGIYQVFWITGFWYIDNDLDSSNGVFGYAIANAPCPSNITAGSWYLYDGASSFVLDSAFSFQASCSSSTESMCPSVPACQINVSGVVGLPALNGEYSLSSNSTIWSTPVYSKSSNRQFLYYDGNGQWLFDSDLNPASFFARTYSIAACASSIAPASSWLVYSLAASKFVSESSITIIGSNSSCTSVAPTCSDGQRNGNEIGVDCGGSCPTCTGPRPSLAAYNAFVYMPTPTASLFSLVFSSPLSAASAAALVNGSLASQLAASVSVTLTGVLANGDVALLTESLSSIKSNTSWLVGVVGGPLQFNVSIEVTVLQNQPVATSLRALLYFALPAGLVNDVYGVSNPASSARSLTITYQNPACTLTARSLRFSTFPLVFTLTCQRSVVNFAQQIAAVQASFFSVPSTALPEVTIIADPAASCTSTGTCNAFSIFVRPVTSTPFFCNISIPSGLLVDEAGVFNSALVASPVVYFDNTSVISVASVIAPSVLAGTAILYDSVLYSRAAHFNFQLSFSKPVVDVSASALIATVAFSNVAAVALNATSDSLYLLMVTPLMDGEVQFQLPQGFAHDSFGNPSLQSNAVSVFYKSLGPTVTLVEAASYSYSDAQFSLTISEFPYGLKMGTVNSSNAASMANHSAGLLFSTCINCQRLTISAITNLSYRISVQPATYGLVQLSVPASFVYDLVGNSNAASAVATISYLKVPSLVVASLSAVSTQFVSPLVVRAVFNASVLLNLSSAALIQSAWSNIASLSFVCLDCSGSLGAGTTFDLYAVPSPTCISSGCAISAKIPTGAAIDLLTGLPNLDSIVLLLNFSVAATNIPSVQSLNPLTASSPVFLVTFSAPCTGNDLASAGNAASLLLSAGAYAQAISVTSTSSLSYSISVTVNSSVCLGLCLVTFSLPSGVCGVAQNSNPAAPAVSITYRTTGPSLSIEARSVTSALQWQIVWDVSSSFALVAAPDASSVANLISVKWLSYSNGSVVGEPLASSIVSSSFAVSVSALSSNGLYYSVFCAIPLSLDVGLLNVTIVSPAAVVLDTLGNPSVASFASSLSFYRAALSVQLVALRDSSAQPLVFNLSLSAASSFFNMSGGAFVEVAYAVRNLMVASYVSNCARVVVTGKYNNIPKTAIYE